MAIQIHHYDGYMRMPANFRGFINFRFILYASIQILLHSTYYKLMTTRGRGSGRLRTGDTYPWGWGKYFSPTLQLLAGELERA